jgi:hypothetical protein
MLETAEFILISSFIALYLSVEYKFENHNGQPPVPKSDLSDYTSVTGESETLESMRGSKCNLKCTEHDVYRAVSQLNNLILMTCIVLLAQEFRLHL